MTAKVFDAGAWVDRLAAALVDLEEVQEPYLQSYRQQNRRKFVIVNGKDETPFPLDDLRMVYSSARHSGVFRQEAEYARLRSVLDPTRHILLSHPELERVAVAGRNVGENNFLVANPEFRNVDFRGRSDSRPDGPGCGIINRWIPGGGGRTERFSPPGKGRRRATC